MTFWSEFFDSLKFKTNLQDTDLIQTDESDNKVLLFATLYAVCCLLCKIFPTIPKQDFGSPLLIARCFSCLSLTNWQMLSRILNQSVVFHRDFLAQKYRCNICPWNSYVWASIYDVLLICFRLLMSKLLQCKYNGEWAVYLLYPSFFLQKVQLSIINPLGDELIV